MATAIRWQWMPNGRMLDSLQVSDTFFASLPGGKPLFWPMFIVVTLASIVASQVDTQQFRFAVFMKTTQSVPLLTLCGPYRPCRHSSAQVSQSSAR